MEALFILIVVIFVVMGIGNSTTAKKQSGAPDREAEDAKKTGSMSTFYRNQSSPSRGGASAARQEVGSAGRAGDSSAATSANPQSYIVTNTARLSAMKRRRDAAAKALERETAEAAIARRQETEYRSGSRGQKPLAQDLNRQRRSGLYSGRHKPKLSGQLVFTLVALALLSLVLMSRL